MDYFRFAMPSVEHLTSFSNLNTVVIETVEKWVTVSLFFSKRAEIEKKRVESLWKSWGFSKG